MYTLYDLTTYAPVFQVQTLAEALYCVAHNDWLFFYDLTE